MYLFSEENIGIYLLYSSITTQLRHFVIKWCTSLLCAKCEHGGPKFNGIFFSIDFFNVNKLVR